MAAQSLGYKVAVLDPGECGPAGSVADRHIRADYLDPARPRRARRAAPAPRRPSSRTCRRRRSTSSPARRACHPPAARVAIAQDRISEKTFLAGHGFARRAATRCCAARTTRAASTPTLCPGIVKSARFGYDGKGQIRVGSPRRGRARRGSRWAACRACSSSSSPLAAEVSVIVARNERRRDRRPGRSPRIGIATASSTSRSCPARVAVPRWRQRARASRPRVATTLDYRGVLCVGDVRDARRKRSLVNEIAPRPHNSGHYTIDACVTSQFEQQARVLAGLPLGRHAAARARGDGEPAGRHLVRRRRTRRASRTGRAARHPRRASICTARPSRGAAARWGT